MLTIRNCFYGRKINQRTGGHPTGAVKEHHTQGGAGRWLLAAGEQIHQFCLHVLDDESCPNFNLF